MQALKAVQPRAEIVIERNQESAAGACMNILDEPDPMAALRIIEKDMPAVLGISVLDDRLLSIGIDRTRRRKVLRCSRNDDSGRRVFRSPQGR